MSSEIAHIRAQHLLITVLGDYWWCRPEHIPSTGLVRVMAEFGVGSDGTRSALSRLTRRGLLTRSQQGRHTSYGLTEHTMQIMREGAARLFSFGDKEVDWNGTWSVIAFSIPEEERTVRHVLRTRLRWLTFGPLYDALWISPHVKLEEAAKLLAELGIENATLFSAQMYNACPKAEDLRRVWDLEDLQKRYRKYIELFQPLYERVLHNNVRPTEAMAARTHVMDAWRSFPQEDPDLPQEFLPSDWPRDEARRICMSIYNALQPMAQRRFDELITEDTL